VTVTFISNYLHHHQLHFCNALFQILKSDFRFISTEVLSKEKRDLGYLEFSNSSSYTLNAYDSEQGISEAMELCGQSDIVIIGSAPEFYVRERIRNNKLTFRYSERLFKKGMIRLLDPRVLKHSYLTHTRYRSKNLHMLCASGYTSYDVSMIQAYPGKQWKFGYFPEVISYDIKQLMNSKPVDRMKILWVGRFLDWKHPERAIEIARRLRSNKLDFELHMIGTGKELLPMKKRVAQAELEDCVFFKGPMSPEQVREQMEKSNILLFTSNKQEGWGAVLNEAMNSACAVVASDAPGSVPYLIRNQVNGLIFRRGDLKQMYRCVLSLIENREQRESIGRNAYATMINLWTPENAADRIIQLGSSLLEGKAIRFEDGPCSKSEKNAG